KLGYKPGTTIAFVALPDELCDLPTTCAFGRVARRQDWSRPLGPGTYDISVASTVTGCAAIQSVVIEPGIQLGLQIEALTCNDNGTDTDPGDDFYNIDLVVVSNGSGTSFQLLIDGLADALYSYGTTHSIDLPASGQQVVLTAMDTLTGCATEVLTAPLNPCSSNCDISVDAYSQECNDNGTPTDPADDFHTVTINVSAVNGSGTNQFELLIDGVLDQLYSYGTPVSFAVPVNPAPSSIQVRDAADLQCFANLPLLLFTSCSDACVIPLPQVEYTCDDNDTEGDASDDFYTITFTAFVTNPGPSNLVDVLVDGATVVSVAPGSEVLLTLPADGSVHTISLHDDDSTSCQTTWMTPALTSCSTQCQITVSGETVQCDDNGTPTDPADDFYEVRFVADAVFGAASGLYSITIDGSPAGSGTYGMPQQLTIAADGADHEIRLVDQDDGQCVYVLQLPGLVHCSHECALTVSVFE
ncbi:MAG: hypothetical protein R3330_13740, partial [Saprospiraceae bacterium]|nr:hypothetical protein [Saprospiraceae bacterium]